MSWRWGEREGGRDGERKHTCSCNRPDFLPAVLPKQLLSRLFTHTHLDSVDSTALVVDMVDERVSHSLVARAQEPGDRDTKLTQLGSTCILSL